MFQSRYSAPVACDSCQASTVVVKCKVRSCLTAMKRMRKSSWCCVHSLQIDTYSVVFIGGNTNI